MSDARGYTAWLVRWDWVGDHAKPEEPIIAILSPRTSGKEVLKFVERYYAAVSYTSAEKLALVRGTWPNPYPAKFGTSLVTLEDGDQQQIEVGWSRDLRP